MFLRKLILSNLSVHRARFALTVAAVALSVSLVVSVTTGFTSMVAVAEKYLGEHMGTSDLAVTRSKGDPHGTFPQSVADDLGRDPRVKSVLVRYESGSLLLDAKGQKLPGRPVELIGIRRPGDQSVEALKMESDKSGAWFNGSREEHDVAVIDQILARRLKVGVGGTITLAGEKPLKLKVVGVIHKPAIMAADQQTVYMPLETMQDFFAKRGQINRVMITLKSSTEADIYKERWLPKIQKTDPLLAMKSAGDMRKQMYENLSGLSLLSYMGATVSMLAATFIVFSALSMGVGERQRVLAMLRAIGAHRAQIGWLVVIEGLMIALAGAGLGAPLGWLWVKILAVWKHEIFSEGVVIDWAGVLFGVVGSMVTALAASFLPAHTASRVDPLEAMSPLAKPPGSRLPFRATLIGLGLIAIDPLLIFPPTSREVKFYGHFALGLPGLMIGFFLLAPAFVWLVERCFSGAVALLLGVRPALLRHQLSSGIWRAAGTAAALMVGLAILIVMQVDGNSMIKSWKLPTKFPDVFIVSFEGVSRTQEKKLEHIPGIRPGELLPVAITVAPISGGMDVKGSTILPQAAMFFGVDPEKALKMIELDYRDADGKSVPPAEQKRLNEQAMNELKLGRHLIIPDEYRRLLGKNRGDKLTINTPLHGPVEYTVSGVVWSPGVEVIVSMFDMGRQFDQRTATSVFGSLDDAKNDFGINDITLFAANLDYGVDKDKIVGDMQRETGDPDKEPKDTEEPEKDAPKAPDVTAPPVKPDATAAGGSFLSGAKKLFGMGSAATQPATLADRATTFKGIKQALGMNGMRAGDVRQIKYKIEEGFQRLLLLLSTIAFASMAVASLGVTNTIMASIRSRRWQFGILRSVGVTRSQLLRLVLGEAILLGLVGCVLGVIAGFWMSVGANGLSRHILGHVIPMDPPWKIIFVGVGLVMLTAILASIWPAASVATDEPLELLQAGRAAV